MSAAKISIVSQIAEVHRELAMRRSTYPRLIARGTMRESEAELCTHRMEAVLKTLMFCQTHETAIRAYIAEQREAEQ